MFKDDYRAAFSKVTASEETYRRVMNMPKKSQKPKTGSLIRKVLIAAAILSLLVVMAGAAEYAGGWFIRFFSDQREAPLTQSQIDYIEENVQNDIAVPVTETAESQGDYEMEIKSAITDGKVAYITVAITAPEGVELVRTDPDVTNTFINFQEHLLIPEDTTGLVIAPDGSSPDALCEWFTEDDGDGLSNTINVTFPVNPFTEDSEARPFAEGKRWKMRLKGIGLTIFRETEDPQDSIEDVPLTDQGWEFELTFQDSSMDQVELVSEPIRLPASRLLNDQYVYEVELTSFTLGNLSYRIEFAPTDPAVVQELKDAEAELGAEIPLDIGDVKIVMKDGREYTLLRLTSHASSLSTPIVLEELDYVLLADGTRLPMPE